MTIELVTVERAVGPAGRPGLVVRGDIANASALPSSGMSLGDVYYARDTGHAWLYSGSTAPGNVNGFLDTGVLVSALLPLPLYALTSRTGSLPPGSTVINAYESKAELDADLVPITDGQRIRIAGWPLASVITIVEAHWVAGAWEWIEV